MKTHFLLRPLFSSVSKLGLFSFHFLVQIFSPKAPTFTKSVSDSSKNLPCIHARIIVSPFFTFHFNKNCRTVDIFCDFATSSISFTFFCNVTLQWQQYLFIWFRDLLKTYSFVKLIWLSLYHPFMETQSLKSTPILTWRSNYKIVKFIVKFQIK